MKKYTGPDVDIKNKIIKWQCLTIKYINKNSTSVSWDKSRCSLFLSILRRLAIYFSIFIDVDSKAVFTSLIEQCGQFRPIKRVNGGGCDETCSHWELLHTFLSADKIFLELRTSYIKDAAWFIPLYVWCLLVWGQS